MQRPGGESVGCLSAVQIGLLWSKLRGVCMCVCLHVCVLAHVCAREKDGQGGL